MLMQGVKKHRSFIVIKKIFNIVIEKEEDEKSYFIHCPQLKGCMSQGDSIEHSLLMFSEALGLYMESVLKYKDKI